MQVESLKSQSLRRTFAGMSLSEVLEHCKTMRGGADICFNSLEKIKILLEIVFRDHLGHVLFHSRSDLITTEEWQDQLQALSNGFSFHYGLEFYNRDDEIIKVQPLFSKRYGFYTISFNVDGLIPKSNSHAIILVLGMRNIASRGTGFMNGRRTYPILGDDLPIEVLVMIIRECILASLPPGVPNRIQTLDRHRADDPEEIYGANSKDDRSTMITKLDQSLSAQLEDGFDESIKFDFLRDYAIFSHDENEFGHQGQEIAISLYKIRF